MCTCLFGCSNCMYAYVCENVNVRGCMANEIATIHTISILHKLEEKEEEEEEVKKTENLEKNKK